MSTSATKVASTENLSGYVLDARCARKSPQNELVNRAKAHSRACGLMGHCIESGFVLIDENGAVSFLDDEATLMVIDEIRRSDKDCGIRLRAVREREGEKIRTSHVEEIPG